MKRGDLKRTIQSRISLHRLGILLPVLLAGAHLLSATTLVVGNCKSGGYDTIQHAITAAPAGATVQVCPGNYQEQVMITQAVTLQGITANNGDLAYISPPSNGLTQTTTNAYGNSVAYQVLVENSSGAVNISNLTVYGAGNQVSGSDIAGIFYQNSFGTVNGVWADYQSGNGFGIGIWLEGGSSSPSVTVENSFVLGSDFAGIFAETNGKSDTALTAKITGNFVYIVDTMPIPGILLESGTTSTVTNNSVLADGNPSASGLVIGTGAAGSVSGNNVEQTGIGIQTYADGVLVTSNRLSFNISGIDLQTSVGAVKGNIIMSGSTGIEFNCNANPHVSSNTINEPFTGLDHVPSGLSTATNKVFNAGIVRTGGC
jgi:hypothetical protein